MEAFFAESTRRLSGIFINHILPLTAVLFVVATGAILWHLDNLSSAQIQKAALMNAAVYSETLKEFRTLYTTEVVNTAKNHGMEITHDYKSKSGAIPLPATLSMLLGNRIGGSDSGVKSRLYSKFPFPWREASGGLSDDFSRQAWVALQESPTQAFSRFEDVDGKYSLRFATSDIMREGCIDCHNSHPQTPKADWQMGDLRGVLEVVIPVKGSIVLANDMLIQTFSMMSLLLFVSLVCIAWVTSKLRLRTTEATSYAEAMAFTNRALEAEMLVRKKAENELRKMSHIDALTGLYNRRHYDEALRIEWKRAGRNHHSIAIIMIDIDDFKLYNDRYGHQAGDDCLCEVAKQIKMSITRETDVVTRYGGEEFVAILPNTDLQAALELARKTRNKIEELQLVHENARLGGYVTISAGVASIIPEINHSADDLVKSADQALYQAKHSGRNCVKAKDDSIVKLQKK